MNELYRAPGMTLRARVRSTNETAHDTATTMLADETKYFAEQKKQEKEEQKR